MGTWGSGNFDSDTAADHLSGITGRLVSEIEEAMAGDPVGLEPDEYDGVAVPCNVELLCLMAEQGYVGAGVPEPAVVEKWKKTFMDVWERTIDGLEPGPGHKEDRRAELIRTFDRLAALADREHAQK
ncbi:DUF4259 domain-containing protein [Streptomyces sp. NBC_00257]|uniref:DUF4259 domain-containing protein n=1 Tax=Streptomyces TaxID=1883 RepID=UPI002255E626|nr:MULTISPECIES: DUF4259 domain-containing protein [unclassified Streptomyces]WTB54638.1 DUF4259 domain-containing protein [Streptomyces sp. NBC_00826]WTH92475.1 DUF4259 domain-containing protein [Streptomyces sp. NBC_00825]WTI01206.1 DUF4259 domain-containing protein [Streptomyces sp. NBC_00822]MCX4866788.1 DUF4259 domain-containing protein [Streptomyces sp. NBC_00906]MCX4898026.1 DUF4259 domain-containing protein [Streptomyces sp. NBC_00892]